MKYVMLYHSNINCSSLYWCWWAEAPHCIDTVRASAHQHQYKLEQLILL